jgi:hypothetical protein
MNGFSNSVGTGAPGGVVCVNRSKLPLLRRIRVGRLWVERRAGVVDVRAHRVHERVDRLGVHHEDLVRHQRRAEHVEPRKDRVRLDIDRPDLRAHGSIVLVVDGLVGLDVVHVCVGVKPSEPDVQRLGDVEVAGAADAHVGEDNGLLVERGGGHAEQLGRVEAEQDPAGAGVEKGRDVKRLLTAAQVKGERRAAGIPREVTVDARLIERRGLHAGDVGRQDMG